MTTSVFTISSIPLFSLFFWGLFSLFILACLYPLYRAEKEAVSTRSLRYIWLSGSVILLCLSFFRTAYYASDLVVSDTVEYAVAAERLYTLGSYDLMIEGRSHPPRYPIGFSLFIGYPSHLLFGSDPGVAIYGVFFFCVLGALAAFYAAHLVGGPAAGGIAVLLLVVWPQYRHMARLIWTDGPAAALFMIALLTYLLLKKELLPQGKAMVIAGTLGLLGFLFRPTNAALCLPFLYTMLQSRSFRISHCGLLFAPLLCGILSSGAYNHSVFGQAFRSGYHYWVGNYYDYAENLFNIDYVPNCLHHLFSGNGPFLIILIIGGLFSANRALKLNGAPSFARDLSFWGVFQFLLISGVPISLFFIFYYFCWQRFFIPIQVLMIILVSSAIGHMLQTLRPAVLRPLGLSLFPMVCIAALSYQYTLETPLRRRALETIKHHTPENALIVTALNPVQVEAYVLRKSARTHLPISRDIEFANKTIIPKRIDRPHPHPENFRNPFEEGYLSGGAYPAIDDIALEDTHLIFNALEHKRPVFIETTLMAKEDLEAFKRYFSLEAIDSTLFSVSANSACSPVDTCPSLHQFPPQFKLSKPE